MTFSRVMETIDARLRALDEWADDHAGEARSQQSHLDEGTAERTYWHLGYRAALSDASALLATAHHDSEDMPSSSHAA